MNRTPLRSVIAVAGAAALALSLAACGSDSKSDDKGSEPKTLSSADFKSQANALCKTANKEIATIEQGLTAATTEAEANDVVTTLVQRIDALVSSIEDLKEPAALSDDVAGMLEAVSSVTDDIKSQGLAFFQSTTDPFADADAKATALGLPDCAGND